VLKSNTRAQREMRGTPFTTSNTPSFKRTRRPLRDVPTPKTESPSFDIDSVRRVRPGDVDDDLLIDLSDIALSPPPIVAPVRRLFTEEYEDEDNNRIVFTLNETLSDIEVDYSPVGMLREKSHDESVEAFEVYMDESLSPIQQAPLTMDTPLRRPLGFLHAPGTHTVGTVTAATVRPAFEIYSSDNSIKELSPQMDTTLPMFDASTGKPFLVSATRHAMLVRANPSVNTRVAAERFTVKVLSISKKSKSRAIITSGSTVEDDAQFQDRRCHFYFQSRNFTNAYNENRWLGELPSQRGRKASRVPLGAFTLDVSLFPKERLIRHDTDLPALNSVFLIPAKHHVTMLAPGSFEHFKEVDHVVIELRNPSGPHGGNILATLAIHKVVFAGLLLVDHTVITINDVMVTTDISIHLKLHVELRRSRALKTEKKRDQLYVSITKIEFSVPFGFEKTHAAPTPGKKKEHMQRYETKGETEQTPMKPLKSDLPSPDTPAYVFYRPPMKK